MFFPYTLNGPRKRIATGLGVEHWSVQVLGICSMIEDEISGFKRKPSSQPPIAIFNGLVFREGTSTLSANGQPVETFGGSIFNGKNKV